MGNDCRKSQYQFQGKKEKKNREPDAKASSVREDKRDTEGGN